MVSHHVPPARGCPAPPPPPWIPWGGNWGSDWGTPGGGEWKVNYGQNRGFAGAQWAAKKDFPSAPKVSRRCLVWGCNPRKRGVKTRRKKKAVLAKKADQK